MPATPTYSPVFPIPATARTQLAPTCRYAKYAETRPLQPLKGLLETLTASVSYRASVPAGHAGGGVASSYRALSPYGETLSFEIKGSPSVLPTPMYIVHCTLYIFAARDSTLFSCQRYLIFCTFATA